MSWMEPLKRAVRVLDTQLMDLERRLETDRTLLPEYRATLREYRETKAMLDAPRERITPTTLAKAFKHPASDAS